MLKLARNTLGNKKQIIDGDGGIIKWEYFERIYEAQSSLPWNLGNKLTKAHLQWQKKKMSVQLAAETVNHDVADSMEFMKQECDQFKEVDATVKYIRTIKDIFKIMNSTKKGNGEGFKRPLSKATAPEMFKRFQEAMTYLEQLKVYGETKSIFSSTVSTAFVGFYMDMISFKNIYENYVLTGRLSELITHRFSQDLLESFFSTIRSMGGKLLSFISGYFIIYICLT